MTFIKFRLFKALGILLLTAISLVASAQGTPDPGPPENPPPPDDTPVPITGIEILIVSGASLGGYKLLRHRRNSKNT
jgi:hypothetical protein